MKYILMMNTMKAGHDVLDWPRKDLQAHIGFMMSVNRELHGRGELVSAEGCRFPTRRNWSEQARMASPSRTVFFRNPKSSSPASGSSMSTVHSEPMRLLLRCPPRQAPAVHR
jgi:hypothetical protein